MKRMESQPLQWQVAHQLEGKSELWIQIPIPEGYKFVEHLDSLQCKIDERELCVIQRIMADDDTPQLLLKLNGKPGRTTIAIVGDMILTHNAVQQLYHYQGQVPVLFSTAGSSIKQVSCI